MPFVYQHNRAAQADTLTAQSTTTEDSRFRINLPLLGRSRSKAITAFAVVSIVMLWLPLLFGMLAGDLPFTSYGYPITGDLGGYLTGANIALDGDLSQLYSLPHQVRVQQEMLGGNYVKLHTLNRYLAPPFVAYLYVPFAILPFTYAAGLWTVLTLAVLILSIRLLWPLVPNLHKYGSSSVFVLTLLTVAGFDMISSGQNTAISLLLLVAGLRLIISRNDLAAGAILGLGIFKPQLFILFPLYFLLEKRWKAFAAWSAVATVLFVASVALVGTDGVHDYLGLLGSDAYQERLVELRSWKMRTVGSFLRSLLPPSFLSGTVVTLSNVAVLAIGGILVSVFGRCVRRRLSGVESITVAYALTVLIAVAFAPHAFNYDSTLLVLPFMLLLDTFPASNALRIAIGCAVVVSTTMYIRFSIFFDMVWPWGVLAAPWAIVPILACLLIVGRNLNASVGSATTVQTEASKPALSNA